MSPKSYLSLYGLFHESSDMARTCWTTPRLQKSSALGPTRSDAFRSCSAAAVSLICRLMIDRPSNAGWYSVKES